MKIIKLFFLITLFLSDAFLFAQGKAIRKEFVGKVVADNKGMEGVAVSDGLQVTFTKKDGSYRLWNNDAPQYIFISLPSGYQPLVVNGIPSFYRLTNPGLLKREVLNFELEKSVKDDHKHTLIVCADAQVGYTAEIPQLDVILDDMKSHVAAQFADQSVYGIHCGDLLIDIKQKELNFKDLRQRFESTGIPFFYLAGNHDLDLDMRSNKNSKKTYQEYFGPTYYSFNRGKVHYVVLDDVFSIGKGYGYIGYLEEQQLQWLVQDLAQVSKGTTVIISMHIPTYSVGARKQDYGSEEINKVLQNRQALYKILAPYNAHILSGHEHYHENYPIGDRLFEHVQSALSGIFWQAPYNSDGTPVGYTVFQIDGDDVSWYFKGAGLDKQIQFSAYLPGEDKKNPDAIIANVWNYDSSWKVCWYENEKLMGEMKQSKGWDPDLLQYVAKNQVNFRYKYIGAGPTEHLFYAVPKDPSAKFRIEVTDRFGNLYSSEPRKVLY